MAIDTLTLALPAAILATVQELGDTLGSDTIVLTKDYHEVDKVEPETVLVQVFPLTRQKGEHNNRSGSHRVEAAYYVAVRRKCKPTDTTKLEETIQYLMDVDDLLVGVGNAIHTKVDPALDPVTYVANEDEQFLWMPSELHGKNLFVGLVEVRYAWTRRVELSE